MPKDSLCRFANEISRIMPEITREFLKRHTKELTFGNISLAQLLILNLLKDGPAMHMSELANYLSVSTAAATSMVDKLVKSGMVTRASSPGDRRIVNILITLKGKDGVTKCNKARERMIMDIFKDLSEDDRNMYLAILHKIEDNLKGKNK